MCIKICRGYYYALKGFLNTYRPDIGSTDRPDIGSTDRPDISTDRPDISTDRPDISTDRPEIPVAIDRRHLKH